MDRQMLLKWCADAPESIPLEEWLEDIPESAFQVPEGAIEYLEMLAETKQAFEEISLDDLSVSVNGEGTGTIDGFKSLNRNLDDARGKMEEVANGAVDLILLNALQNAFKLARWSQDWDRLPLWDWLSAFHRFGRLGVKEVLEEIVNNVPPERAETMYEIVQQFAEVQKKPILLWSAWLNALEKGRHAPTVMRLIDYALDDDRLIAETPGRYNRTSAMHPYPDSGAPRDAKNWWILYRVVRAFVRQETCALKPWVQAHGGVPSNIVPWDEVLKTCVDYLQRCRSKPFAADPSRQILEPYQVNALRQWCAKWDELEGRFDPPVGLPPMTDPPPAKDWNGTTMEALKTWTRQEGAAGRPGDEVLSAALSALNIQEVSVVMQTWVLQRRAKQISKAPLDADSTPKIRL